MKYEIEGNYQISVDYSCEYDIIETENSSTNQIKIKCRFREYFPFCRDDIDTAPIFFDRKPSQEELETFRYGPAEDMNFEIIKGFVTEAEEIYRSDDGSIGGFDIPARAGGEKDENGKWIWKYRQPWVRPIVLGFETMLFVDKSCNVSEEQIHQRIQELVNNCVALITHPPLVKLEPYDGANVIIDTKPKWVPMLHFHQNVSDNDKDSQFSFNLKC